MAHLTSDDLKRDALARSATLHPHPERVSDPRFHDHPFFDPRDALQVKYEMLRRVRVDGLSVSQAAADAGMSRPTYYLAHEAYERAGLAGLLPEKKGPKRAHKLTPEVLAWVEAELAAHPGRTPAELARRIQRKFKVRVHPKSIGRAKKNRAPSPRPPRP